jgi:serine phosphatase RsbU (regulator of sigma subunit)
MLIFLVGIFFLLTALVLHSSFAAIPMAAGYPYIKLPEVQMSKYAVHKPSSSKTNLTTVSKPTRTSSSAEIKLEMERLYSLVGELEKQQHDLLKQKKATEEALELIEQDNFRKTRELLEARQLQLAMLPNDTPVYPGYEVCMRSVPATEVGGDYYDYRVSNQGDVLQLVLADATGHGFKAGVLVAMARSHFRMQDRAELCEAFFIELSRAIRSLQVKSFYLGLTGLRLQGNWATLEGTGMPPVLHYVANTQQVKMYYQKGLYLGIADKPIINCQTVRLHCGDALLMLTDGLAEVHNADGEMLGYEAIRQKFEDVMREGKAPVIEEMLNGADAWRKGRKQSDDITMVYISKK